MGIAHREENFIVIELGSHTTKAVLDTSDINKLPDVVLRTRGGVLKQDASNSAPQSATDEEFGGLKGEDSKQEPRSSGIANTQDAAASTTPLHVNGIMDVDPAESTQRSSLQAETEDEVSSVGNAAAEAAAAGDSGADRSQKDAEQDGNEVSYVFGSALESATSDALESTVDMMVGGFVQDWEALSAFLRHIITKELGIPISRNGSPILFSIPALWSKTDLERLAQVAFEHLNAPTIVIAEQPLAALYGNGKMNGLVVDIGHTVTTITPVVDSCIQPSTIVQSPVAGAAVTRRLHELLEADPSVNAQFDSGAVPLEFAERLKESGLCRLRLALTGDEEDGDEQESASPPEFEYEGKKFRINTEILAKAPEVLVEPTEPGTMRLTSLMQQAALACDPEKRTALWENINIVGGSSRFGSLKEYLQSELEATVLPASNMFAVSQTREIKILSVPDYFVGWRNHDHWAGFLGACIMAKIIMNDAKHNITRAEYNENGPSIVHTKPS
ncbi:hypothetical protein H4217_003348 [Coemansia sp. RSA 1939]|nr:hypothetical protein H4217_003348 [Coemansia sp. RSA 1939]KAJ2607944.1 hypothetical protein EV177_005241 [Coemansia sp. RSA 1804]